MDLGNSTMTLIAVVMGIYFVAMIASAGWDGNTARTLTILLALAVIAVCS